MRQIPHHQRAGTVRTTCERRHVVHRPGPEIHVRQHYDRGAVVDRISHVVELHQLQFVPLTQHIDKALRHVQVGREVRLLRQDHSAFARRHLWTR